MTGDFPLDASSGADHRHVSVMGVVNVTPDSFSDGGRYLSLDAAVAHGVSLAADGADVLDVGGESTRPGATPVPVDEELRRVVPVVEALARAVEIPLSVDTTKSEVAGAALDAGASIVNDVSAGRSDDAMVDVVRRSGAAMVLMHMRGAPATMQDEPSYEDVVGEVIAFLRERVEWCVRAGIDRSRLVVDPGIGFGKTVHHNLALLADLDRIVRDVDAPVLVGASRKSFIGAVLDVGLDDREEGTLTTTVWAAERGASIVRVHDVAGAVRAVRLRSVVEGAGRGMAA